MTWQDTKRYKQRKREELERVKLLHDLFFKNKKQPKDKRAPNV